ncbi:MAG: DUF3793 family protein [Lachnospiraceae bacterium]
MSQDVIEIIQQMDQKKVENQLALQCAPVLTGEKASNLLNIGKENAAVLPKILRGTGISCRKLFERGETVTVLLFWKRELETYFAQRKVQSLLKKLGYGKRVSLEQIFLQFEKSYAEYEKKQAEFPHEIGLLLAYPVEDVEGFIEQKGQRFLYAGYWKVYANVPEKKALFQRFDLAKESVIWMVTNGVSIRDIVNIYLEENNKKQAVM